MGFPSLLQAAIERTQLDRQVFGNRLYIWILALAFFFAVYFLLRLLRRVVETRAKKRAADWRSDWPTVVEKLAATTSGWFLLSVAAYLAARSIDFPLKGEANLRMIAKLALLIQSAQWAGVLVSFFAKRWIDRRAKSDPGSVALISILGYVGRALLWTVVVLLVLENLGVQVTALVTGLGIGGVAVALAAQNILGDLFASLSIVVDRPFLLGDFIVVGADMGTVEKICLKTTRVRALSGEQISFPNSDLLQSRIRNTTRQFERRVVFNFSLALTTPPDRLVALSAKLRQIVERRERVRFDRAHFQSLTENGCRFEVVYFVTSPDFNLYMDIQQQINLDLLEHLNASGLSFATSLVAVQGDPKVDVKKAAAGASSAAADKPTEKA